LTANNYFSVKLAVHEATGPSKPIFCVPTNFIVPRKICFKHIIKTTILTPENVFSLQNLQTLLRACEAMRRVECLTF